MPVALGYLPHHLLLLLVFVSWSDYIYKDIGKLVPLHPCVPMPPTTISPVPEAHGRHMAPPWWGASTIDCHDCVFPGERHRVTPARVFIKFRTPGEGPQYHETLHHAAVLELVPNWVRVVWEGLLEESFEVVCRWPRLTLVATRSSHDTPLARVACLLIIIVAMIGRGCGPLGTLLAPPLVERPPWHCGRPHQTVSPCYCLGSPPCFPGRDDVWPPHC
jgi:hypothetical protein